MKNLTKETARILRGNSTQAEKLFWEKVRNRKFQNLKFRRQHPIEFEYYGYIRFLVADFFCAEKNVVIEIDGKIHDYQQEYDKYREYIINELGYRVIRITNDDVYKDIEGVLKSLTSILSLKERK